MDHGGKDVNQSDSVVGQSGMDIGHWRELGWMPRQMLLGSRGVLVADVQVCKGTKFLLQRRVCCVVVVATCIRIRLGVTPLSLSLCHAFVYCYVLPLSVPLARLATSTRLMGSCRDLDV